MYVHSASREAKSTPTPTRHEQRQKVSIDLKSGGILATIYEFSSAWSHPVTEEFLNLGLKDFAQLLLELMLKMLLDLLHGLEFRHLNIFLNCLGDSTMVAPRRSAHEASQLFRPSASRSVLDHFLNFLGLKNRRRSLGVLDFNHLLHRWARRERSRWNRDIFTDAPAFF